MKDTPFLKYDERKGIDFSPWGGIQGFLDATSNGGTGKIESVLKRISPWMSRAVDMTAVSISNLPFEIVDAKAPKSIKAKGAQEPIDTSANWENKVGGMPNPKRILSLVASSLCGGQAYLYPDRTERRLVDLVYYSPNTIMPQFKTSDGSLDFFQRNTEKGKSDKLQPDQLIYFWLPDSDVEIGPALKHPLGAATISALLTSGFDKAAQLLADRYFVPATIVGAKGMASQQAREQAENWLSRFFRGAFQSHQVKVMNAEDVSVVKVGGGMEDLKSGFDEIKRGAIEGIGAAFGIPAGIFMSDKAYATEMDALIRTWYESSQFVSIYQCIEETLNDQLLIPMGYKFRFRLETIDAFQEDETKRAAAYREYVSADMRPSIAAQILGIELPEGTEPKDLDEKFDRAPEPPILVTAETQRRERLREPVDDDEPEKKPPARPLVKSIHLDADQQKEIVLWRQRATAWHRKGKGGASEWECKHIPEDIAGAIRVKLAAAMTELDIVKAFEINADVDGDGLWAVSEGLNRIADLISGK